MLAVRDDRDWDQGLERPGKVLGFGFWFRVGLKG